jgi:hypothetical protein
VSLDDGIFYTTVVPPYLLVAICFFAAAAITSRRLRIRHKAVWDDRGPMSMSGTRDDSGRFMSFFIFGSGYKALGDPALNRRAFWARFFFWGGAAALVVGTIVAIIASAKTPQ